VTNTRFSRVANQPSYSRRANAASSYQLRNNSHRLEEDPFGHAASRPKRLLYAPIGKKVLSIPAAMTVYP